MKLPSIIPIKKLLLMLTLIFLPFIAQAESDIKTKGGLTVTDTSNPNFSFTMGSLLQLDNTWFSGSPYDKQGQFPNGAVIRRLFLNTGGTVNHLWGFTLNTSIQSVPSRANNAIAVVFREAYIQYKGITRTNIEFGHVAIPSSLENWADYSDLLFIDNSLIVGGFFPSNDYGLGVYADHNFLDMFTIAAAIYQPREELSFGGQLGLGRSDRLSEALRVTFSPVHTKTFVLHFGAWSRRESLNYSFMGAAIPLAFAFEGYNNVPEAVARNTGTLVNTGNIRAKSNLLSGLEFAAICGPSMMMTEYLDSRLNQIYSNTDPAFFHPQHLWFKGGYIQGSYVFTGESHVYDFPLGLIRRPVPAHWYGAWEIALRYSYINLNDKSILGGVEHNFTLGLNGYITEEVRLFCNYVHASARPSLSNTGGANNFRKRKLDIFALRIQIAF